MRIFNITTESISKENKVISTQIKSFEKSKTPYVNDYCDVFYEFSLTINEQIKHLNDNDIAKFLVTIKTSVGQFKALYLNNDA